MMMTLRLGDISEIEQNNGLRNEKRGNGGERGNGQTEPSDPFKLSEIGITKS